MQTSPTFSPRTSRKYEVIGISSFPMFPASILKKISYTSGYNSPTSEIPVTLLFSLPSLLVIPWEVWWRILRAPYSSLNTSSQIFPPSQLHSFLSGYAPIFDSRDPDSCDPFSNTLFFLCLFPRRTGDRVHHPQPLGINFPPTFSQKEVSSPPTDPTHTIHFFFHSPPLFSHSLSKLMVALAFSVL